MVGCIALSLRVILSLYSAMFCGALSLWPALFYPWIGLLVVFEFAVFSRKW